MPGSIRTGIYFENMLYPLWSAAIAAGATLDELQRIDEYPKQFQARLIAWHEINNAIESYKAHKRNQALKKKTK